MDKKLDRFSGELRLCVGSGMGGLAWGRKSSFCGLCSFKFGDPVGMLLLLGHRAGPEGLVVIEHRKIGSFSIV